MNKYRKITALLLALILALSFAACNSSDDEDYGDDYEYGPPNAEISLSLILTTKPIITKPFMAVPERANAEFMTAAL